MRTTFLRPPVDVLHKFSKPVECLALGYLGSAARHAGHEATLLDGMLHDWSIEESVRQIMASAPDLVGMTIVLNHFPEQVALIARGLREAGFTGPLVVGGHAASFYPDRILDACADIDAVVCGEGEVAIAGIADALEAGCSWSEVTGVATRHEGGVRRSPIKRVTDPVLLAHPARDLTQQIIDNDGLAAMSTSRGCYARCTFCSIPRFYGLGRGGKGLASGDWLGRTPESMAAEVLDLHERLRLLELLIVDDEFFGGSGAGQERAIAFADLLNDAGSPVGMAMSFRAENAEPEVLERLARGGLRHCFIGLESGVEEDLKLFGKAHSAEQNRRAVAVVKGLGLSFQPGFMLFHFESTVRQLRRNLDFLREIGEAKPVTVNSSADPHFGTPLLRKMQRENVVDDHGTSLSMRFKDPSVTIAKTIAEEAAYAFQPFMNTIAGLQSAITYEWRRAVPGRSPAVSRALDRFEELVNDRFVSVVETALGALDQPSPRLDDVLAAAREDLSQTVRTLSVQQSLTMLLVNSEEGGVRYRTQQDLMRERESA
jgi:anaerobic magnesium-protoporphyrin IX monomethyl ester cyclase